MDLNNDGHPDILTGSYADRSLPQMAGLFYILWGQENGAFKAPETLTGTDKKPLIITGTEQNTRTCTRPTAVDFTGNGHLDLVVGNFEGTLHLFEGQGKGQFSPKSTRIEIAGKALNTGSHSDPFFADMDRDGDLDLISGSDYGGISMIENTAGKGKPITLSHNIKTLLPQVPREAESWADEERKPAAATRVTVADVNEDGKLDLLFGDMAVRLSPKEGIGLQEAKTGLQNYHKEKNAINAAIDQTKDNTPEMEALIARSTKNYALKSKLISGKYTGSVWVIYQK